MKLIPDIQVGEEVLTHTGKYRPVTAAARRWHEGTIHKLRVGGSNQVVRITAEHPVLVVRGSACVLAGRSAVGCRPNCQTQHKCSAPRPYQNYRPEWVPAGDVREGDWVAFPRRKRVVESAAEFVEIAYDKVLHRKRRVGRHVLPVDARLAKFLGYFIAEGNAQARGLIGFGFHRAEETYHREVSELAARFVPRKSREGRFRNRACNDHPVQQSGSCAVAARNDRRFGGHKAYPGFCP